MKKKLIFSIINTTLISSVVFGAENDITINEIMYNSGSSGAEDWIEIYNNSSDLVDLTNWQFKDDDDTHIFTLPQISISGNEFLVICRDTTDFKSIFPSVSNFIGNFDFGLGSNIDQVRIFNASGVLIDSLQYDDNSPWPIEPDGDGPSLELISPDSLNTLASNWAASLVDDGSPGLPNSTLVTASDTTKPEIANLELTSQNSITLTFSEIIDASEAENVSNYSIDNGIGNPSSATLDSNDSTIVHLNFANFTHNTFYTFTVNNVEDLNGNVIQNNSQVNFNYFSTFDIVINEIMYNPPITSTASFVEIFNKGSQTIDLSGWSLNGFGFTFPNGVSLNANSFLAIVSDSTAFNLIYSTSNYVGGANGNLQNNGETLTIFDNSTFEQEIDVVTYDNNSPWPTTPNGNGPSLELLDATSDNSLAFNWNSSQDSLGTPGEINSVTLAGDIPPTISEISHFPHCPNTSEMVSIFASINDNGTISSVNVYYNSGSGFLSIAMNDDGNGVDEIASDNIFSAQIPASATEKEIPFYIEATDNNSLVSTNPLTAPSEYHSYFTTSQNTLGDKGVVINEIMYNSSDSFGASDWIELYNRSTSSIDLGNWELKDNNFSNNYVIPTGVSIAPNEYLVVCVDTTNFKNLYPNVSNYIGNLSFGFSGSGDQARIYNSLGTMIDSLEYEDDTPWPTNADGLGSSLERDNPILVAGYFVSWSSSNVDNGTPGEINSVFDGECNHSPIFTQKPSDLTMNENELLTFTLEAYDPNGDLVIFFVDSLPQGATYDSQTSTFNWIPDFTQSGDYNIFVGVTDGVDTTDFKLDVEVLDKLIPTNEFVFFYGDNSTLDGNPISIGDTISAFDSGGTQCGEFIVDTEGEYGLMPVYKDDSTTPNVDEGATVGEQISFKINGFDAAITGPNSGIWTTNNDIQKVNLVASSTGLIPIYDLRVEVNGANVDLSWTANPIATTYKIYRGSSLDSYVLIGQTINNSYTDSNAALNQKHFYIVTYETP